MSGGYSIIGLARSARGFEINRLEAELAKLPGEWKFVATKE